MSSCRYYIILLCCCTTVIAFGQNKSNRGKEFWLGYGYNYGFFNESPVNTQELAIYISTEAVATVTVSINGTAWSQTLNIPANTADASILIPKSGVNDARIVSDGLSARGIHIVSDVPVAAYAHVYANQLSGATMLMPVETYGYSYYSVNYYQTTSQSNPPDWYSWFYVIASEDNTKVIITPSDSTKNGWLPGNQYTVTLNKGETYSVFGKAGPFNTSNYALCSKDMTGSKIISVPGADGKCHPIALFSGSSGIRFCRGDGGEFMHQQVFPLAAWGTRYLTYHTINNSNTDLLQTNRNLYRICVQDPTTVVKKNGVVMTGLIKSFYYEYMDSTGGDYIESDKPILLSQYMVNKNQCWNYPTSSPSPPSYGDPEMFYLSPIEQGQKSVLFYTSRKSTIDYVYVNIFLPSNAISSLKVDGVAIPSSNIITHPNNSLYSVAIARFIGTAAQHTITCDSAINATVYGLGNYESYGYNVGTYINNLNNYSAIKNTNNFSGEIDTFSCPKTPLRIFIKLGFPATKIHWKLSQVSGISPNADSIVTNPVLIATELINGRTYYVYSLQQDFVFANPGTYTIPVTYESTVIENCSQSEDAVVSVLIKPGLVADFTISANNCQKDTITFAGSSSGPFTTSSYKWTFPDNTNATTQTTTKAFLTAGTQTVNFKAYASNGCVGDTSKQVTIHPVPLANFGLNASSCAGTSVLISDSSSIAAGSINNWLWILGDGNTVNNTNGNSFSHPYNNPGNYTAALVTTSALGCKSDTAKRQIIIYPKPVAKFGSSGNICVGDSIRFSDSSSITPGSINNWKWLFGDGQNLTASNANPFYHPYTSPGSYVVKLVVTSASGCSSDTFSLTVIVAAKQTVSFITNGVPCIDSSFTFTSSIAPSATPATWHWIFGDGQSISSSTTNNTTHAYSTALSNIKVKHIVDFGGGCRTDTVISTIPLINANPSGIFNTSDTLCEDNPVTVTGSSPNSNITWHWDMGASTVVKDPPFNYTYANSGNYTIRLVVKNTAGCSSAPATRSITIHPAPVINAGIDKIINLGTSVQLDAFIANPGAYDFLWSPATGLSNPIILNPVAEPKLPIEYTIKATDKIFYCTATDKIWVRVVTNLEIPNAFSPNKDGINDTWGIKGIEFYPNAVVSIFTRYGQLIFESRNYNSNPWNGTFNGKDLPVGSYAYIIKPVKDKSELFAGTLVLLR